MIMESPAPRKHPARYLMVRADRVRVGAIIFMIATQRGRAFFLREDHWRQELLT